MIENWALPRNEFEEIKYLYSKLKILVESIGDANDIREMAWLIFWTNEIENISGTVIADVDEIIQAKEWDNTLDQYIGFLDDPQNYSDWPPKNTAGLE